MVKKRGEAVSVWRLVSGSGLSGSGAVGKTCGCMDDLPSLAARVRRILGIVMNPKRKPGYMICFIMYDIGSNKVRTQIAKYLLGKGCHRVQKSIFMADLPADRYREIGNALAEVQNMYDNHDGILIVPLSEDYARAMKVIGQQVNLDIVMHTKNTLFF